MPPALSYDAIAGRPSGKRSEEMPARGPTCMQTPMPQTVAARMPITGPCRS